MDLKDYIFKLEAEVKKESEEIWANEKQMSEIEFLSKLARSNGKLTIINDLRQFMLFGGENENI